MSTLASTDAALADFATEVGSVGAVAVRGGGTRALLGGPARSSTRMVSAPDGIVEYRPSEMTVTARAGTSVACLHRELASKGQRTALPERGGTVGGAVAVGENCLDMLRRGRVRDAVLQVRYVSAEGAVVTGGGPVVKNVSGFNLPKLMTGSLGTLGLIAEVVLRTNPIPPASQWLRAEGADPVAVFNAARAASAVLWNGSATWIHLEGHAADVDAEVGMLSSRGDFAEVSGPPLMPPQRWSLSPASAAAFDGNAVGEFVATIGVGTVFADAAQPERPVDPAALVIADRLKAIFDPTGRLNPGRRVGG